VSDDLEDDPATNSRMSYCVQTFPGERVVKDDLPERVSVDPAANTIDYLRSKKISNRK
jgi:hypothetical protein